MVDGGYLRDQLVARGKFLGTPPARWERMRVVPVIDLLDSLAVHAVAGDRARYAPLRLHGLDVPTPLAVAQWYHEHFGLSELYLADLTAIQQGVPALRVYDQLSEAGFHLIVDPGIRSVDSLAALSDCRAARTGRLDWIVGLESIESHAAMQGLGQRLANSRPVFSLDFRDSRPICGAEELQSLSAEQLFSCVIDAGFRRVLTLDLRRVGVASGVGTSRWLSRFRELAPDVELLAGGGVRGVDDLWDLQRHGCNVALVATALYRGTLARADIASL
ncbi:MAG: HisA/HisF-related TIM barrel protein [Pirellulales bacterium]